MKTIPLTRGYVAVVDDEDYEWLVQWNWSYCESHPGLMGYAVRSSYDEMIYMHRAILSAPTGIRVDHANLDTLDNRRSNLRLATRSQQGMHRSKRVGGSSYYKGVCWDTQKGKWRAYIMKENRQTHLGLFTVEADAARAYNTAAQRFFGAFARLNDV